MPPYERELCAPICHAARPFSECLVANITLRQWVTKELTRAGFDVVDVPFNSEHCIRLPLDHDVEVGALVMLAGTERSTVLMDQKGEILAWKGVDDPAKAESHQTTEAVTKRIRYPWDLLELNSAIVGNLSATEIRGEVSSLAHINGFIRIGEGTQILPGVVIEGNVLIGKNCHIGPNCYIRGNTSIGDNSIIGNAVEIKNSIIYPHARISHLSFVGDSIIGSHVNLGAGTIISNFRHDGKNHRMMIAGELVDTGREKMGAIIGDGVRTGINTSIYPARKIGMGRITLPGEVVKYDLN